jgi:hypothetical protein
VLSALGDALRTYRAKVLIGISAVAETIIAEFVRDECCIAD